MLSYSYAAMRKVRVVVITSSILMINSSKCKGLTATATGDEMW